MNQDLKIFIEYMKYKMKKSINLSSLFLNIIFWEFIAILIVVYVFFFSNVPLQKKALIYGFLLIIIAILRIILVEIVAVYRAGEHRYWYRKKLGIPSLKKLKYKKWKEKL